MFCVVLQRQINMYVLQHFVLGLFLYTKVSHYHNHGILQKPNYVLHKCTFCVLFWGYCIYALQCTHTSHNCNQLGKKRYTISSMCVFCSQLVQLHSQQEPTQLQSICLVAHTQYIHTTHSLHRIINKWQTRTGSASRRLRLFPSSGAPELHFLRQANFGF